MSLRSDIAHIWPQLQGTAAQGWRSLSTATSGVRQKTWLQEAKSWGRVAKQLSKARLSALVVSTTAVGFVAGIVIPMATEEVATLSASCTSLLLVLTSRIYQSSAIEED